MSFDFTGDRDDFSFDFDAFDDNTSRGCRSDRDRDRDRDEENRRRRECFIRGFERGLLERRNGCGF